jgi:hypothetical protein
MTRFQQWMLKRILRDTVRQDGAQERKITRLYAQIREAAEQEYYEDNKPTIDSFLKELFNRSFFANTEK